MSTRKNTPLLDQLISALEAYKALLTTEGLVTPEEYELDQDLRATNFNMSILDPLQVLYDLKIIYERRNKQR